MPGAIRWRDRHADEAALVARARNGDRTAFGVLLRRHDDRLRGTAWRLLGDRHRMDDALQEAYVKAFRALPTFHDGATIGPWLHRIVTNACIDELRRGGRRPAPVGLPAVLDRPSSRPDPATVAVTGDEVRRALGALNDDQRVAVVLVDGEGLDRDTVAELLGVSAGTVASRLARGRLAARTALGLTDD